MFIDELNHWRTEGGRLILYVGTSFLYKTAIQDRLLHLHINYDVVIVFMPPPANS